MSKIDKLIEKLCPNGVEYKTIGELFDVKNGYTPSKNNEDYWLEGNVPWFRMEDIRANGKILNDSIQHITEKAVKNKKFPKNSLMVATTATIGIHALIEKEFVCNQQLTCVSIKDELKDELNIKFCFYYFDIIDKQCVNIANQGGGMPIVSLEKMKKLVFPVPPLEVQHEIVHILDDFTLLSAELSAELKARQKQYEYYENKLFDFDNRKIEFRKEKLEDIASFTQGLQVDVNRQYYKPFENSIQFLRIVDFVNENEVPRYIEKPNSKYIKNEDEMIMIRYGASAAGKVFTNKTGAIANNMFKINLKNKEVDIKYLKYYLSQKKIYSLLNSSSGKSTMPAINFRFLGKLDIDIPKTEEQKKIVNILDRFDKLCNDILEGLPAEIEARQKQYEYYRDKMLSFKELK